MTSEALWPVAGGELARLTHAESALGRPQQKWGPALLPAPTAPSEGSAGIRSTWSRPHEWVCNPASRSWLTSSGVASHPTILSLGRSPTDLLISATRRIASSFNPSSLALGSWNPCELRFPAKTVRCSTALLGLTSLASRFAPSDPKIFRCRVALEEDQLFRRLLPTGPASAPEGWSHHLPAEIGPLVTCRIIFPFPAFR